MFLLRVLWRGASRPLLPVSLAAIADELLIVAVLDGLDCNVVAATLLSDAAQICHTHIRDFFFGSHRSFQKSVFQVMFRLTMSLTWDGVPRHTFH